MKKKKLFYLLLAIMILTSNIALAKEMPTVKLWINGSYVVPDVPPFIENDRTMVPIRIISETLGFKVLWEPGEQKIIIYAPGNEETDNALMLRIGDTNAYPSVNNIVPLDVAPKIVNDRTFVPIRAIAELFNLKVDWDNENRTVIIGEGYYALETMPDTYNSISPRDGLTISPYPDRQIKGNINSKGERIYHTPGQRDYDKTIIDESDGERWFATEQEALEAGWRKALR